MSGSASAIQSLKKDIDKGKPIDFTRVNDPNVISGLLKLYLRELPEPLCTYSLYPELTGFGGTFRFFKELFGMTISRRV